MPRSSSKIVVLDESKNQSVSTQPLVDSSENLAIEPISSVPSLEHIEVKEEKSIPIENKPKKIKKIGTKEEVYNGLADHTKGGVKSDGLMLNKNGIVVSAKRHKIGLDRMKAMQEKKNQNKNQ